MVWALKNQRGFFCLLFFFVSLSLAQEKVDSIERSQILNENVSVSWIVDFLYETVTFKVTAKTLESITFGLSYDKDLTSVDLIFGGVSNGVPYFTDRFSNGTEESTVDEHQDCFLLEAFQNSTHTVLEFQRKLDTCDTQDLPIDVDTARFIWFLGSSDSFETKADWGVAPVNLLDPDSFSADTSMYNIWEFSRATILEGGVDTTEWCTIHKTPREDSKHHIVGYKMFTDTPEAAKHIHHVNINRCITKPGSAARDQLEKWIGHPGGTCFLRTSDPDLIQSTFIYCPETIFFWAKGGDPLILPENVGRSLNEDGNEEYFIFQVHYDNPDKEYDVIVDTKFHFFTTPILREYEPALLFTGDSTDISVVVPPNSPEYVIAGHCSSNCTGGYLPPEGINVFNVMMHTHNAGVQMKVRHFRPISDDRFRELPWICSDKHFDNNWQQTRATRGIVNILPGDHITVECTYDNTYKIPPQVTLGGGAAESEMCRAYLMYYPKMDDVNFLGACVSQYPLNNLLAKFGIEELDLTNYEDPTVLQPPEMFNKTYSTVLNTMIDWTPEFRQELQQATRYDDDHFEACLVLPVWDTRNSKMASELNQFPQEDLPMTNYPENFEPYEPPSQCSSNKL